MPFSTVFDTGLHADCVRFVPEEERNIAVFSCYELDEFSKKRLGKLILAEAPEKEDDATILQEVDGLSGVFEFNWFRDKSDVLVTALAEGPPKLFKYSKDEDICGLKAIETTPSPDYLMDSSAMTLAVAGETDSFMTCDNLGGLKEWSVAEGVLEIVREWKSAHDAEIWYVSQDRWDANSFYTGADDGCMKLWDRRSSDSKPVAVNSRSHEAGVCCVLSSPFDEFIVASGSYDGNARIWDRRMLAGGPTQSIACGSGVWRVVWHPSDRHRLAVAAMRAGFHLIDLKEEVEEMPSSRIYRTEFVDDHVAYGIDWKSDDCIASCSFYNNQGQFWRSE